MPVFDGPTATARCVVEAAAGADIVLGQKVISANTTTVTDTQRAGFGKSCLNKLRPLAKKCEYLPFNIECLPIKFGESFRITPVSWQGDKQLDKYLIVERTLVEPGMYT